MDIQGNAMSCIISVK